MRKTRYNQIINRYFRFHRYSKGGNMFTYSQDNYGPFIITNGFSMVRINWNLQNPVLYKRYNELEITRLQDEKLQDNILNMFESFEGYNIPVKLENCDYMKYCIEETKDKFQYDGHMIENIINLICKNKKYGVFMNEEQKAICITGEYGYAYLLPMRVF